jgi:hypothetical protein
MRLIARRDKNTHGVFIEASEGTLQFYGDGYSIIKDAYEYAGSNAETMLLVEISCGDGTAWDELYYGKMDYSRIKFIDEDYCGVEIAVEQTGCFDLFRQRDDMMVNITSLRSLDSSSDNLTPYDGLGIPVELPPKKIYYAGEGKVVVDADPLGFLVYQGYYSFNIPEYEVIKEDFDAFLGFENVAGLLPFSAGTEPSMSEMATVVIEKIDFAECLGADIVFRVWCDIDFVNTEFSNPLSFKGTARVSIVVYHCDSAGNFIDYQLIGLREIDCNTEETGSIEISGNVSFVAALNDRYYVGVFTEGVGGSTGTGTSFTYTVNDFRVQALLATECEPTTARMFMVAECLSRVTEIITNGCMYVYSDYFGRTDAQPQPSDADGCAGMEAITTGLYLRGAKRMDGGEPDFFISMKKLYEGLNAIHNIGMGIEDDGYGGQRIRVEPVEYFYADTLIHTCDEVKEIRRSYDISRAIAIIQVGYKKWSSEYTGGLDEMNSEREYRTELTGVKTKLDCRSEFIASSYAIEVTRRQGATTEDYRYDDDVFIICMQRGYAGATEVEIFNDLVTSNVLSPDNLYNVRITPVRNLMRWYKTARTVKSSRFKFNSGTGNYVAAIAKTTTDDCLLETQTGELRENVGVSANLFKTSSNAMYRWLPEIIDFEYPLSYTDWQNIRDNPRGYIRVTQRGKIWDGYIIDLVYTPAEGMAQFKLLRK